MIIKRVSPLTKRENTMDIPVTQEQLDRWYRREGLIQDIMSDLTAEQREFIMTGYTQQDWDTIFPPEQEDEDV